MTHARLLSCIIAAVALATWAVIPASAVTIEWVTVGDPGNVPDLQGSPVNVGAVAERFRIGKYEVTIQQYTDFLNAVAASDPYSLYNSSMATDLSIAGISRTGSSGSYSYSVIGPSGTTPAGASSPGNRPITYVSWFDAARFANWMHNGQGSGSTETGVYALNGAVSGTAPAASPNAQYFIPTQNQWYKAAYYRGGRINGIYWDFATQSFATPGNIIGSGVNQLNYRDGNNYAVTQSGSYTPTQNYLTDVGAFTNSPSFYGTFDQSGGVGEWNDLDGVASSSRGFRGGSWLNPGTVDVSRSIYYSINPAYASSDTGFRLAAVPEPSTYALALVGLARGAWQLRRRKAKAA